MKLGIRNEKLRIRMTAKFCLLLMISTLVAFNLASCADSDGLHDQNAVKLTIKFINFPAEDGDYSLPGDFNGDDAWENENKNIDITLKDGTGTSSKTFNLTATWAKFSLVPVGSWTRSWVSAGELEGNSLDEGKKQNFSVWNISLDTSEQSLIVDGSKSGTDEMLYFE